MSKKQSRNQWAHLAATAPTSRTKPSSTCSIPCCKSFKVQQKQSTFDIFRILYPHKWSNKLMLSRFPFSHVTARRRISRSGRESHIRVPWSSRRIGHEAQSAPYFGQIPRCRRTPGTHDRRGGHRRGSRSTSGTAYWSGRAGAATDRWPADWRPFLVHFGGKHCVVRLLLSCGHRERRRACVSW